MSDWLKMGRIRDFFRSDFRTFWLGEPKCSEIWSEKSRICPISSQSDPLLGPICPPVVLIAALCVLPKLCRHTSVMADQQICSDCFVQMELPRGGRGDKSDYLPSTDHLVPVVCAWLNTGLTCPLGLVHCRHTPSPKSNVIYYLHSSRLMATGLFWLHR